MLKKNQSLILITSTFVLLIILVLFYPDQVKAIEGKLGECGEPCHTLTYQLDPPLIGSCNTHVGLNDLICYDVHQYESYPYPYGPYGNGYIGECRYRSNPSDSSCGVQPAPTGQCGDAAITYTETSAFPGTHTLCASGTPVPASPADPAIGDYTTWQCGNVTCYAYRQYIGECGTANLKNYVYSKTAYAPDTQCTDGFSYLASNTAFPAPGQTVTWYCPGIYGGRSSNWLGSLCQASRQSPPEPPPPPQVCLTSDTWTYNPNTNVWTQKTPTVNPTGALTIRGRMKMVWDNQNNQMILYGGSNEDYSHSALGADYYSQTWVYDPDNTSQGTWTEKFPVHNPGPRAEFGMAWMNNTKEALLFGGREYDSAFQDTWFYDPNYSADPTNGEWIQQTAPASTGEGALSIVDTSCTTITIDFTQPETDPANTTYSIKVVDNSAGTTYYVQPDHSIDANAYYQTYDNWSPPLTITDLILNTEYAISYNYALGAEGSADSGGTFSESIISARGQTIQNISHELKGEEIYFIWTEKDASDIFQVWTASMTIGSLSSFAPVQRTNYTVLSASNPQMVIAGEDIHYVWNHSGELVNAVYNIAGDTFAVNSRGSVPIDSRPSVRLSLENKVYYFWLSDNRYMNWATTNLDGTGWSASSYQLPAGTFTSTIIKEAAFDVYNGWIYMIYQNRDANDVAGELSTSYAKIAKIQTNGTNFTSATVDEYQDSGQRTKFGNGYGYKIFASTSSIIYLGILDPRLDSAAVTSPEIPFEKQVWMATTDQSLSGFSGTNFITLDSQAGHGQVAADFSRNFYFYLTNYSLKATWNEGPRITANQSGSYTYDNSYQLMTANLNIDLTGLATYQRINNTYPHDYPQISVKNECDTYLAWVDNNNVIKLAHSDICNDPSANSSAYSTAVSATTDCEGGGTGPDSGCDIIYQGNVNVSGTWPNTGYGPVTVVCVDAAIIVPDAGILNIEPGVVVKFVNYSNYFERFIIDGTLNVGDPTGTDNRPVYFTDGRDDTTPDGDTNHDGAATVPVAGDWGYADGIYFESNTASRIGAGYIYNAVIRYPREKAIYTYYHATQGHTPPDFRNILIENGTGVGIYSSRAIITVDGATIRNMGGAAFEMNGPDQTNINLSGKIDIHHCGTNGIRITPNYGNNTAWTDLTFTDDLPYYFTGGRPTLADPMTLTINPGAVLKFDDTSDYIFVNGYLDATGTEDSRIYFTSIKDDSLGIETHPEWFDDKGNCIANYPCDTNNNGSQNSPAPNDWGGLVFEAANGQASGTIEYASILYAGDQGYGSGGSNLGAIKIQKHNQYNETEPIINNVLIENANNYGIYIDDADPTLSNITINNCNNAAIYLDGLDYFSQVHFLGQNNISNNFINGVYSPAVSGETITSANFQIYNDMPFVIDGEWSVGINGSLTVEKNSVIKFYDANTNLYINGVLNVNGTSDQPVYFTSFKDDSVGGDTNNNGSANSPAPNDWDYITFDAANGPATGSLNYAVFQYAGNNTGNYGAVLVFRHNDYGQPEPTFNGCTFRDNGQSGLHLFHSDVSVTNFTAVDNAGPAIFMWGPSSAGGVHFSGTNTATGNSTNGIAVQIRFGDDTVDRPTTWDSDFPYYVYDGHLKVANGATWTLEPGTIVKHEVAQDNYEINGTIIADGTPTEPVIFTSIRDDSVGGDTNNDGSATSPAANDWGSFWFRAVAGVATGNMDNVIIKYAGRGSTGGNYGETYAAITIDQHNTYGRTEPTLSNVTILNSGNYGIEHAQSNFSVNNLTVKNCALAAVYTNGPCSNSIATFSGDVVFENNGINANQVHSHVGYGSCYYFNTDLSYSGNVPYYFEGVSTTVNDGINISFGPGAVVKFASGYSITNYGHINAIGTADQPIYFTSIKDDTVAGDTNNDGSATTPAKGDWQSITSHSYSGATPIGNFKYANFRYGGGGGAYYDHELVYRDVTVDNSEVSYSNFNFTNKGLYSINSKVNIHHNTFSSASDYGMHYNNPPAGTVFSYNTIDTFDTGIFIESVNNKLVISNNNIDTGINGILSQTANAGGGGVEMRDNYVNAGTYYIRNNSTPFQTPAGGTTVDAYENTWGSYPVSDAPAGQMYKNPGNILYDNHGVVVTSPNGGDTWPPGTTQTIAWTTYNDGGNADKADLYYSVDGGENWTLIDQNLDNTGGAVITKTYEWVVPKVASLEALVRVDIKDAAQTVIASDTSGFFFITETGAALEVILGDPRPSHQSAANNILYTNIISSTTIDGSVKIVFAPEFDFSGITAADVKATGGNIIWSDSEIIDTANNTVVFPFTGQLDSTDGTLRFELGSNNKVTNPSIVGIYNVDIGIYPTADGTGAPNELRDAKVSINYGLLITANIPQIIQFDLSVVAVASGENVNGAATNLDAVSGTRIDFGKISGGDNRIVAHDLTVDTNLQNGYLLEVRYTGPLAGPIAVNDFPATNADPQTWLVPSSNGYFGYTSSDSSIPSGGAADRFTSGGGNKWAAFTQTYAPIAGSTAPITETTRFGYRLNLSPTFTQTGLYVTEVMYLATSYY